MKTLIRFFAILFFLPIIAYTILWRVWHEIKSIPFYIWCDLRGEFSDLIKMIKTGESK